MSENTTVLVLVGSLRAASVNRQIAELAAETAPHGVVLNVYQGLGEVPFYSEEIDNADAPAAAVALRAAGAEADAVLVVTPEYNGSIPAVLKNAIDWAARPYGKNSWRGKPAAVIGTSGGVISTAVVQHHLRAVLGSGIGMHVLGGEAYIQFKPELIDSQGNVPDETVRKFLKDYIDQFAAFAGRLAPQRAAAA